MSKILKQKTKCPVCKFSVPIWIHLSFNNNVGLDCPNCHSLLGHAYILLIPKWISLFIFALSVSKLIDGYVNLLWILLSLGSISLLFYIQLTVKFVIKYKNSV